MPRSSIVLPLALFLAVTAFAGDVMHIDLGRPDEKVRVIIELAGPQPGAMSGASRTETQESIQRVRSAVEQLDARVHQTWSRVLHGMSATIRRSDLETIRGLPGVARVRQDRRFAAFLTQSVPATRADLVWNTFASRGAGVTIAVIDTGIDWQHPAVGAGFGPGYRVKGGWDFVNDDADPDDDNGHGSHVAGIAAGNAGVVVGVAPEANLLAYKVLDAFGGGNESDTVSALERAVDPNGDGSTADRADVINLSLGGPGEPDDPAVIAVQNAIAAGSVVVASAGNHAGFYTVGNPAMAPDAITVGALNRTNERASFSSRGPSTGSLLLKPEVMAPGVGIVSAKRGGGAMALSGTSMAAPHVAGIAALLRALRPELTPAEVKSAIVGTAAPLNLEVMAGGSGMVDAFAAASSTVFASPAALSFGRTSGTPAVWSASTSVSLTNRSTVAKTMSFAGADGLSDGIELAVTPSSVVLEPGATRTVTVALDVDNSRVPAPLAGSLSFGGTLRFHGGGSTLRVPWAFVKAAMLTVIWKTDLPFEVTIVGEQTRTRMRGTEPSKIRAFLPASKYNIVISSTNEAGEPLLVVYENLSATGDPVLSASKTAATHAVDLASTDERGAPLAPLPAPAQCDQHVAFDFPDGHALDLLAFSFRSTRLSAAGSPPAPPPSRSCRGSASCLARRPARRRSGSGRRHIRRARR